ncbi:thioredoxin peroxidase dot5 [Madurella fahalii]|uniref:thioredoxin-dependent peroxiredoxin n=1 Tax=Madurella fahalii TaxID=1157608 RepID=A0ABQ0GBQ4_9PEZI
MPVELRKRKAPPPPPPPAKKQSRVAKTASKVKETVKEKVTKATASANGSSSGDAAAKPAVGDIITLDGFGGEIETNDGAKTTLKALVDESKAGVALFTYPKASTPGCTRQACLFRDAYSELTSASGLTIYGLSSDSPKANTAFKEKQKLPYPLLCDPQATLIGAIGLKKAPKGTTRGVFVVDKTGKVLAAQAGGPEATVNVVKEIVEGLSGGGAAAEKVDEAVDAAKEEEEKKEKEAEEKGEDKPTELAPESANGEEKAEEKKE